MIDKVAWILLDDRRILSTRSHGRALYYLPGGKREPGEADLETLYREIHEELSVEVLLDTASFVGEFTAQADAERPGVQVRMRCYESNFVGDLRPDSEIAEMRWLTYQDRALSSPVDRLIFDHLALHNRL